jgi:hypothetical protein
MTWWYAVVEARHEIQNRYDAALCLGATFVYGGLVPTLGRLRKAAPQDDWLEEDWDRFESLHWQTLDDWLLANPGHPKADEFRARGAAHRDRYLRRQRDVLGWAIFVCRS